MSPAHSMSLLSPTEKAQPKSKAVIQYPPQPKKYKQYGILGVTDTQTDNLEFEQ